MKISLLQFEIMTKIERKQEKKFSQNEMAETYGVSLQTIEKVVNDLIENEFLKISGKRQFEITLKGYEALEPYRVKKAIFMAAGFGSRMVPITLNTPKPLILVHGKKIIETLLDAVIDVGINDITIVRGYLGEQFDVLLRKYPMIKFVDNPMYNESNNISSAYLIRDNLEQAYVLESDLVLYNPEIIRKYEYRSNYTGMKVDVTDDWCFETKDNIITKVKVGGTNVHHMFGISYWSKEDAKKLKIDIEQVFQSPGGKEKYWDEVSLRECIDHYDIMVRQVKKGDVIEIDTFNELKLVDPIYNI